MNDCTKETGQNLTASRGISAMSSHDQTSTYEKENSNQTLKESIVKGLTTIDQKDCSIYADFLNVIGQTNDQTRDHTVANFTGLLSQNASIEEHQKELKLMQQESESTPQIFIESSPRD